MKRLIAIAGLAAMLGACNQAEPAPEAEVDTTVEEPAATAYTANGSPAGTYVATDSEGVATTVQLNADGTYVDTDAEGITVAEGTWAVTDGKTCFSPTTEGAEPMCHTEDAAGADGSFTATADSGETVTVRPIAPIAI